MLQHVFNTNADPSLSLIRMVIRACLKYECWSKLVFNTNADPSLSLIQMLIQACLKYECWSKLVFNANIDPSLFLKPPSLLHSKYCFRRKHQTWVLPRIYNFFAWQFMQISLFYFLLFAPLSLYIYFLNPLLPWGCQDIDWDRIGQYKRELHELPHKSHRNCKIETIRHDTELLVTCTVVLYMQKGGVLQYM